MLTKAAYLGLGWDFSAVESVAKSQRWVLSAMGKHGQDMVTMLWRILGNEQDVCDAYQQTFLQLAHYGNGTKPDNVDAYLFRTAANTAVSILRHQKLQTELTKKTKPEIPTTCDVDYAANLDAKLMRKQLRTFIAKLPEYLRDVIILRELAELPYNQVGNILGITAATARVYRFKAITLLAAWMAKDTK